ncbi:MAG: hypothetical protein AB7K24_05755 [Gemmataceae bacterium]
MKKNIDILEFCAQEGIASEPDQPILRGVKILGGVSKNRRRYTGEAVEQAARLYEGLPVNIDHPEKNTAAARGLRERFGKLLQVRNEAGSLRGDLHYNPKHPLAEAVRWWAENQPDAIGLSHNATGTGHTEADGTFVVDKIVSVRSVDIVADPATTRGLFEAVMNQQATGNQDTGGRIDTGLLNDEERAALEALRESSDPHVQRLLEAVSRQERQAQARALMARAKLPAVAITEVFVDQVAQAGSEAEMRRLIEDRLALFERARVQKPRSSAGSAESFTAQEFAQALKQ